MMISYLKECERLLNKRFANLHSLCRDAYSMTKMAYIFYNIELQ